VQEEFVVGSLVAVGQVARRNVVGGGTDHFAALFADQFEKRLVAAEITPFDALVENRTGNRLDQLAHEMQLLRQFAGSFGQPVARVRGGFAAAPVRQRDGR
jgi:hypothetical protein